MKEFLKKLNTTDIRNVLAIIIVMGCFTLLGVMQLKPMPIENKDIVLTAIGFVFGGALAGVVGFYFGGNKQPKNENDKI